MKFHLNYTPARAHFSIDHHSPVFLAGSCFAENIGKLMKDLKFKVTVNPDGILFNPLSIAKSLSSVHKNTRAEEDLFVERDGVVFSYLHHSSVKGQTKKELVTLINETRKRTSEYLKSAGYLILTFGSAFVYHHKSTNQAVANCHKQPEDLFEKKLLTSDEIIEVYSDLIEEFQKFNPALKIIFTVSPVKYLRDGLEGNSLSKAILLVSIHALVKKYSHCVYFPAYELISDDLRDYRFYKEDLAHPADTAIDYVWEKFGSTFFTEKTNKLLEEISRLNRAQGHRPLHTERDVQLNDFIEDRKKRIRTIDPELNL